MNLSTSSPEASRSHVPSPGLVPSPVAHTLSLALALFTCAAALPTLLVDRLLLGPAAMNGSARGTALMMLVLGVPVLLGGQLSVQRGVSAALPVWLGAVAFLTYNAFMLLFATPFNSLFLLYVAMFSLALWSLVAILRVVDVAAVRERVRPGAPRHAIAVFVWVVAGLNALAWLGRIVPALADPAGADVLHGTGLTTIPTYVQDLAVWLPLLAVAGVWLWRDLAWGHLVVAAMLVQFVLEAATVAVDQLLGSRADPASVVASAAMTPAFAVLALVTLVPAVLMLRRM